LAKLICHGAGRDSALRTLAGALAACEVAGVTTNLDLLHRIVVHPAFATGGIDTGFIPRHADTLLAGHTAPPAEILATAALAELLAEQQETERTAAASPDPWSPWHARDQWWVNTNPARVLPFEAGEARHPVEVRRAGGLWAIRIGEARMFGRAFRIDGTLEVELDGVRSRQSALRDGETMILRQRGETWRLRLPDPIAHADETTDAADVLIAPIPGQVTRVDATVGMAATRGQVLVVLE